MKKNKKCFQCKFSGKKLKKNCFEYMGHIRLDGYPPKSFLSTLDPNCDHFSKGKVKNNVIFGNVFYIRVRICR